MEPILSIAIPTFNRSDYMVHCLESLLHINGNLEIVVSDSSSDLKLKKLLEGVYGHILSDSRVKYFYTEESLDMTANLNRALEFCSGHYVIFLGDDDTLVPEVLQYLEIFKALKIDLISPDVVVNYAWPDFETKYFKSGHKSNLYSDYGTPYIKVFDTSTAYYDSLNNCFQGTEGLPKLYHGFVARELLLKIKRETGNFLHGSTPDMSAAIGLCFVADHFVRCNFPLTIPGASGMSNTGRAARNQHVGNLEDEAQTSGISRRSWIVGMPRFFSVEVVWAQSGFETASKFNNNRLADFPFGRLIALCVVNHSNRLSLCISAFKELERNKHHVSFFEIGRDVGRFFYKKLIRLLKRLRNPSASNGRDHIKNVLNIHEAMLVYERKVQKKDNFDIVRNLQKIMNSNL